MTEQALLLLSSPESLGGLGRGGRPGSIEVLHAFDLRVVEGQAVAQLVQPLLVWSHAAEPQHLPLQDREPQVTHR